MITRSRPPHIVSRSDLARLAECHRARVTEACRPGGLLEPATRGLGDRVDLGHSATLAFLARYPFARDEERDDYITPEAFNDPVVGESDAMIRAYLVRAEGRVLSEEEFARDFEAIRGTR